MRSRVSIVRCGSYDREAVRQAVDDAVGLLGGITAFVKPGRKVLVKPNLLMAQGPEIPVCTHPEFIRAVVRMLKAINAEVLIGDGPSVWGGRSENVDEVYDVCGIREIARDEGCGIVYFDKHSWFGKIPLAAVLNEVDCVVSLPKLKTHNFTVLTAGVKNLFGLVSSSFKLKFHRDFFDAEHFSSVLVDIYEKVRPALTIIDAVTAMQGDGPGPSGTAKQLGLALASRDAVALDSVASTIMGLHPENVPTNRIAEKRQLGNIKKDSIELLGEDLSEINVGHFQQAGASIILRIPAPLAAVIKRFLKAWPLVLSRECRRCRKCAAACPEGAISFNENKDRIEIDYGKCISCFCCQETCPYAAIATRKSLLARLIGL
ncbi:MAG: DUF362 domain-containing protein [Candidatus Omnitrophica bacterium]|nr:DUF362 domain-containing protein [Candidatus Omnitrophota bacterium]